MTHYFDLCGWETSTVLDGRSTEVSPPSDPLPEGWAYNWSGVAWVPAQLVIPYVPPPAPELPSQQDYIQAVQEHLDTRARDHGYDNILSMASYSATGSRFEAEGAAAIAWRGDVWTYCFQTLADIQAGIRPVPTIQELLEELPKLSPEEV